MTKNEFKKWLNKYFSQKGFYCKSGHYYKEITNEVMIVFGLQYTNYGGKYCYLECGYCFKSINKYLPYPKYNQLNLNCGRVMTSKGKAIFFETLDEYQKDSLEQTIKERIDDLISIAYLKKDEMIKKIMLDGDRRSWYILGDETAAYFNLSREDFKFHFVLDE